MDHHEEAGTKGQAARHISAEIIRRYRDVLTRWIRRHRAGLEIRNHSRGRAAFIEALDACVVLDLAKIGFRSDDGWKGAGDALNEIAAYPDSIGFSAREAIMEYLTLVASRTRSKMPPNVARMVRSAALETAKLYFLGTLRRDKPTKSDAFLREIAADVGRSLVYDGALYVKSLDVVEAGAEILWRTLACAVLTQNARLKAAALEGFDSGFDAATRGDQPDATTILTVFRDHGIKGGSDYPSLPRELILRLL